MRTFLISAQHYCISKVYQFPRDRARSILYGYWKCGTRARMLSQTLAHEKSTNERRKIMKEDWKQRVNM